MPSQAATLTPLASTIFRHILGEEIQRAVQTVRTRVEQGLQALPETLVQVTTCSSTHFLIV